MPQNTVLGCFIGHNGNDFCCGVVNRGVALWQDLVIVGTLDGYLVALDRATGQERFV